MKALKRRHFFVMLCYRKLQAAREEFDSREDCRAVHLVEKSSAALEKVND